MIKKKQAGQERKKTEAVWKSFPACWVKRTFGARRWEKRTHGQMMNQPLWSMGLGKGKAG